MRNVEPDVVSVALDPKASGPRRHYEVLHTATSAVQQYAEETKRDDTTAWGYRDAWFRFESLEVSTIIPVSLQTISTLNHMCLSAFEPQRESESPAYGIQFALCAMSQEVQVEQLPMFETCLGYQRFHAHPSPLICAKSGLVFLQEMRSVRAAVNDMLDASGFAEVLMQCL